MKKSASKLVKQTANARISDLMKKGEQGDVEAQWDLGARYAYSDPKDYVKALYWWEKAADQGDLWAQLDLAMLYYEGEGVQKDFTMALYWWEKAAEQGDLWTQLDLGMMYFRGECVLQDYKKARYWWEKAAAQGKKDARSYLRELKKITNPPSSAA